MNRRTFLKNSGLAGGLLLAGTPFGWSGGFASRAFGPVERLYVSMGTTVRFLVFHSDEREALSAVQEAQSLIDRVHALMSVQDPESELARWNRSREGLDAPLDPLTSEAMGEALRYVTLTEGRFDPTVGAAVAGLQHGRELMPQVDRVCEWDPTERQLRKSHADIQIDLGGSAKGWAVDRAVDVLCRHGIKSALVNAGGDLRVIGAPPDEPAWRIGIRNPADANGILGELMLTDRAVATSGTYERKGSTIVDPRDGERVRFRGSATIVAPSCGQADCISTAICVEPNIGLSEQDAHLLLCRIRDGGVHVERSTNFPAETFRSHLGPDMERD